MLDAFLHDRDLVLWAVVAPFLLMACIDRVKRQRHALGWTGYVAPVAGLVFLIGWTCVGLGGGFVF